MIKKILNISGIGRFADYKVQPTREWDGSLGPINVVYAPNGSGKTTLSTILKSIQSRNTSYLELKKTFDSDLKQIVRIVTDGPNALVELQDGIWSKHNLEIEVLDVLFIEDYLYTGSILNSQNKLNLFKLILGEEGRFISNDYKNCKHELNSLQSKLKWPHRHSIDIASSEFQNKLKAALQNLKRIEDQIEKITATTFAKYIEVSNTYLQRFAPYIKFDKFEFEPFNDNSKKLRLKLIVEIHGKKITFTNPDLVKKAPTVKYTLSEGDKSAIALCFFLARLEIVGYKNKIIVFDDPLSSFDYGRKLTTINTLAKIATECEQFILLTHDLHFAKDFSDKITSKSILNLKIENNGYTSLLHLHNIHLDTLSSLQKDFQTITEYLKSEIASDIQRREIVRCIRPILEGVIKTKYFDLIATNEWLGDIIAKIRVANSGSRLEKLQNIIEDIVDLNDFSKRYHHSSNGHNDTINPFELKKYINLLMLTVDKI